MEWQSLAASNLVEPWASWTKETHLLKGSPEVCILYVPTNMVRMASSLEYLTMVFPLAKTLYPTITSLIVSDNPQYDLVIDGDILITNVGELTTHEN